MTRQNAMKRQEKWWKNWRKETPNWSPSSVCRLLWFSAESLGQNTAPAPGQNKHTRLTNITTEDTSVNDFLARPFVGQERATPPNGIARQKWPPDRLVSLRRYWTTTKPTIKTQYTIKSRTDFGQSGQTLLLDVPDELLGTEVQHFLNVQFGHVDADRDAGTVGGGQRRFVFRDRAAGSGGRGRRQRRVVATHLGAGRRGASALAPVQQAGTRSAFMALVDLHLGHTFLNKAIQSSFRGLYFGESIHWHLFGEHGTCTRGSSPQCVGRQVRMQRLENQRIVFYARTCITDSSFGKFLDKRRKQDPSSKGFPQSGEKNTGA